MANSTTPEFGRSSRFFSSLPTAMPGDAEDYAEFLSDYARSSNEHWQRISESAWSAWQKNQQRLTEASAAMMGQFRDLLELGPAVSGAPTGGSARGGNGSGKRGGRGKSAAA